MHLPMPLVVQSIQPTNHEVIDACLFYFRSLQLEQQFDGSPIYGIV